MKTQQTLRKQAGFIQFIPSIIAGASAIGGAISGNKARKRQNAARRAQQQVNRIRNFQSVRAFMRQFKEAQAAALIQPIASGAEGSSMSQATRSSQQSQARVAGVEFQEMNALGEFAGSQLDAAARASFQAGIFGSIASFAGSAGGSDLITSAVFKATGIEPPKA